MKLILFLARAVDGLTGGNISVAYAYVADVTPEDERNRSFGRMAVSSNLGFVVGPALAGVLGATALGMTLPPIVAAGISLCALLLIGFRLQGIIGAVLVLPLVAAYPIIERHWLGGYLRSRVLTDHVALAKAAESGSETAIDTVISGEKHASEAGAGRPLKASTR